MRFNYTSILLILLAISVIYAVGVLVMESDSTPEPRPISLSQKYSNDASGQSLASPKSSNVNKPISTYQNDELNNTEQSKDGPTLPSFLLVGLKVDTHPQNSIALVSFKGELYEYSRGENILDANVMLAAIKENSIEVNFNQQLYTIELTEPNLLLVQSEQDIQSYEEMLNMTSQDIGTRPRIMEHLATLIPTPFIADGVLIKPGLNPALFEQAGFIEDDVLKTVNGKSVTVESEFELIKAELKTAQTLEFTVMRKGVIITLYLDIPSEALEISKD